MHTLFVFEELSVQVESRLQSFEDFDSVDAFCTDDDFFFFMSVFLFWFVGVEVDLVTADLFIIVSVMLFKSTLIVEGWFICAGVCNWSTAFEDKEGSMFVAWLCKWSL